MVPFFYELLWPKRSPLSSSCSRPERPHRHRQCSLANGDKFAEREKEPPALTSRYRRPLPRTPTQIPIPLTPSPVALRTQVRSRIQERIMSGQGGFVAESRQAILLQGNRGLLFCLRFSAPPPPLGAFLDFYESTSLFVDKSPFRIRR